MECEKTFCDIHFIMEGFCILLAANRPQKSDKETNDWDVGFLPYIFCIKQLTYTIKSYIIIV